MYSYIYDSFLNNKKYEKQLIQLENRVTDLGINGHIHKLSVLKSLSEIVKDEINSGTTTIIAVGNDKTFSQIIDVIAEKKVTLGIIPVGSNNSLANSIGITPNNAIENLSRRIVEKIDLGLINDIHFISSVQIPNCKCVIENNGYKISPRDNFYNIDIYNFIFDKDKPKGVFPESAFSPSDGVLDAVIYSAGKTSLIERFIIKKKLDIKTFLSFKKMRIITPPNEEVVNNEKIEETSVIIDGHKTIQTPVNIKIIPKALKIIVGKDRAINN
jgi:diacylglycerol kinase family enzyme